MTQIRLSIELEVTQETISAYEIGKHYPSIKSLLKMSQLFHSSIDYILGLSDIRDPALSVSMSEADQQVLSLYHDLNPSQKERSIAYMQGLLDSQLR